MVRERYEGVRVQQEPHRGDLLRQKAEVRDNPSVELSRVPSPAAGPGSANAEDIQRALSWCQACSS